MSDGNQNPFEGLGDAGFPDEQYDQEQIEQEESIRRSRQDEVRRATLQGARRSMTPRQVQQQLSRLRLQDLFQNPQTPVEQPQVTTTPTAGMNPITPTVGSSPQGIDQPAAVNPMTREMQEMLMSMLPSVQERLQQSQQPVEPPSEVAQNTSVPASTQSILLEPFVPDFGIIDIDTSTVGRILTAYCHRGSRLVRVDISSIDISSIDCTVTTLPPPGVTIDLPWLLQHGMKFFDAIFWLSASTAKRPPLSAAPDSRTVPVLSHAELSKAIFYIYFFLLTQAKYPSQAAQNQPIPSFLRTILGLTEPPSSYVPEMAVNAYQFARTIATSAPTWNIHPITRDPAIVKERGNLNKNLTNLMLLCFTTEDLTSLVTNKQLFAMPTRQVGYDNWTTWQANVGTALSNPIFP
ncbi:hypothetical protein Golomagni_05641 [Golovinomyces magnicellulatus]|nr:hypothetical protein Golomagni_05641 [Golovinomyces magnicellulatus]